MQCSLSLYFVSFTSLIFILIYNYIKTHKTENQKMINHETLKHHKTSTNELLFLILYFIIENIPF